MASAKVFKMDGSEAGTLDLDAGIFEVEPNATLVHEVVVGLRNAQRQGNASTKNRTEVRGGGKKPYRQKGTGSARHGSSREPQMRGGGVAWGPKKRSYKQKVPTAFRRKALCCVLSDRVRSDALYVLDSLTCDQPKTKPFADMVGKLSPDGKKTLFVTVETDDNVALSARNLKRVGLKTASDLNALDVLKYGRVVVVRDAVAKLEERLK